MKQRLPLSAGTILQSRYTIVGQLGHGGMGAVYEAHDRNTSSPVALKETFADDDYFITVFEREAQLLANLDHEALPKVTNFFAENDGYFLVMDLIRGQDLEHLLAEKGEPFEVEVILAWADKILDALEYLHSEGIVHQDIKPANIKLTLRGKIKLLDFGIAKGTAGDLTKFSTINAGTAWSAPLEQVLQYDEQAYEMLCVEFSDKTIAISQQGTDTRSDLYALGATLYEVLTNRKPAGSPSRAMALWAGQPDKLRPAHEINQNVSLAISTVLQKAMEIDLDRRLASATEFRRLLVQAGTEKELETVVADKNKTFPLISRVELEKPHRQQIETEVLEINSLETLTDLSSEAEQITQPAKGQEEETNGYKQAIAECTKAIELAPYESGTARAYFERGHAYFNMGDSAKAFQDFDQAIELDEFTIQAFPTEYNVRDYDRAIELNPNNADAHVYRGAVYDLLGDHEEAIANYRMALEIEPNHKNAKDKLGKVKDKLRKIIEQNDEVIENSKRELEEINKRLAEVKAEKEQEQELEEEHRHKKGEQAQRPQVLSDLCLIPYRKGDRWGFCDSNKNIVIEPKYELGLLGGGAEIRFTEGLAHVILHDKHGYIDKTGQETIPIIYNDAGSFSEGLAHVRLNDKYGYIDKFGAEVLSAKYDRAESFSEGLACVKFNGKYGYVDKTGQEIIPIKYDVAKSFSEGLANVWQNGKYGFIDIMGREITPIIYDAVGSFSEGLACVKRNDGYGFIDKNGREITPIKYDDAQAFSEGLARVRLDDKCGFVDKTGREIVPIKYGYFTLPFSEGLAAAQMESRLKFGYIDKTGREVLSMGYENAHSFSEGLALVLRRPSGLVGLLKREYGYIDKTGQLVIPIKYDVAASFSEGLACVTLNDKSGYIDKTGREVIPTKYYIAHAHSEGCFREGLVRVKLNGKTGYIGRDGTEYFED